MEVNEAIKRARELVPVLMEGARYDRTGEMEKDAEAVMLIADMAENRKTPDELIEKYTLKIGQSVMAGEVVRDLKNCDAKRVINLTGRVTAENRDGKDYCEIVRCKDCIHCDAERSEDGLLWCNAMRTAMMDMEYCSHGERREDGTTN